MLQRLEEQPLFLVVNASFEACSPHQQENPSSFDVVRVYSEDSKYVCIVLRSKVSLSSSNLYTFT